MINPLKNWKTFWSGVVMISGGASGLFYAYKAHAIDPTVITTCLGSVGGGIGLIFARDGNVTSVDMGLQGVTTNAKGEAVITPDGPKAADDTKDKIPCLIAETKQAQNPPKG